MKGKAEEWMRIHVLRIVDVEIQNRIAQMSIFNSIQKVNLRLPNACDSLS